MKWYNGGIAEAITVSKLKSAIFVVYIEGKDDKSTQLTQLIEQPELSSVLESDKFVPIKIEADSVPHQQFGEIYKNITVPSLYFIGKNGQPLEIIKEPTDVPQMLKQIDTVVVKGLGINQTPAESASNFISGEQQQQQQQPQQQPTSSPASDVVCENGVCAMRRPEDSPTLTAEEKVRRARELVDKQNAVKAAEEKEREKQREIERRRLGQDMQQMKRWQEDQELKQLREEREREKRESQAARQRVLDQIEQDKAERASRFAAATTPTTANSPSTSSGVEKRHLAQKSDTARLQFKLPDGSSKTNDFPSSDSLSTVRTFIATNLDVGCTTYTLSTTFPRREFTAEDDGKSLLDLQLTPNAVILILPINKGTVTTNRSSNGFSGMMWTILSPFLSVLGFLKLFIFGGPAQETAPVAGGSYGTNSEQDPVPSKKVDRKRRQSGQSNVHRLNDLKDSDDDTNTWNGNSTQQM